LVELNGWSGGLVDIPEMSFKGIGRHKQSSIFRKSGDSGLFWALFHEFRRKIANLSPNKD
jgi:hypothetical protein